LLHPRHGGQGNRAAENAPSVIHSIVFRYQDLVARAPIHGPQVLLDGSGVRAQRACQQYRSDYDYALHGILRFVGRLPTHLLVGDETQEVQNITAL
jgi:hypothetical protein